MWLLSATLALGATLCSALNLVEFDRAFGGKGSGRGGFSRQIHLAFTDEGTIIVSDAATRIVQKLSPDGEFLAQYPRSEAESLDVVLVQPGSVAVDAAGNIYVADITAVPIPHNGNADKPPLYLYTPCVHQFDASLRFLKTIPIDTLETIPKAPVTPVKEIVDAQGRYALAIQPTGYDRKIQLAVDLQGNLFVLDAERPSRQVVIKYSPDGTRLTTFGRYGSGEGEFDSPKSIAVGRNGNVYIADSGNDRIVVFDNDGVFQRAFASRGLGKNEVTKPFYIAATKDNRLLVKDDSTFVRKQLRSVPLAVLSLSAFSSGQRMLRPNLARNPLSAPLTAEEELALRLRRLEELALLEAEDKTDKTEQSELEDSALKTAIRLQNTLYHTVIHRLLAFDVNGKYLDEANYRLDQMDEKLHDLEFVAVDPMGNIYLQDASDYSIRRYRLVGFSLRPRETDIISSTQTLNQNTQDLQDYEDIDQIADVQDDTDILNLRQRLLVNYDISPRWNFLVELEDRYSRRNGTQEYPEKVEDGLNFLDRNFDNDLYVGLRRVLNPNPYRYKEMTLYVQRQDGSSTLNSDALFPQLNRQKSRQEGTSGSTLLGLDWDIARNANFQMQYYIYNPSDTSRNYTRSFYDLQGNLYQVLRTRNQSKVLAAELNLKF